MLTPFNRVELITTFSAEKQKEIKRVLSENHVLFEVKIVNRTSPNPFGKGGRGEKKEERLYEYMVFVHKDDYEKAQRLILK